MFNFKYKSRLGPDTCIKDEKRGSVLIFGSPMSSNAATDLFLGRREGKGVPRQ